MVKATENAWRVLRLWPEATASKNTVLTVRPIKDASANVSKGAATNARNTRGRLHDGRSSLVGDFCTKNALRSLVRVGAFEATLPSSNPLWITGLDNPRPYSEGQNGDPLPVRHTTRRNSPTWRFPKPNREPPGGWDTVGRDVSLCVGALVAASGPPRRLRPAVRKEIRPGWSTPGTAVVWQLLVWQLLFDSWERLRPPPPPRVQMGVF